MGFLKRAALAQGAADLGVADLGARGPGRVAFITTHTWASRRRGGFHMLADAYRRAGWDVLFFTVAYSWLSALRRGFRLESFDRSEANHLVRSPDGVSSFVWFPRWHPANLRLGAAKRIASPLFRRYDTLSLGRSEDFLREADVVIFESTAGLLLFDRVHALNPRARMVYRVSDDLSVVKHHPVMLDAERRVASRVDLVSVPNKRMAERFPNCDRLRIHPHSVEKELFDRPTPSPFREDGRRRVVFVGVGPRFDSDLVRRAAALRPDVDFHLIGPLVPSVRAPNVRYYGEMPFAETVPYLKHADVGLHNPIYEPGVEVFADSLKVLRYTYCKLPILAPDFFAPARPNFSLYKPGDDESIAAALDAALAMDRNTIDASSISSWEEIAAELAGSLWRRPRRGRAVGAREERVVLVSQHYLTSKRRAGFHLLADAYWRMGRDVVFVTAPVSWISWIRRDPRFAYPLIEEANEAKPVRERLTSYVLFTPTHPTNLRLALLNWTSAPLFERYRNARLGALAPWLEGAKLVIFECGAGIMLFDQVRDLAPGARVVYRVSDDTRTLGLHPVVIESERALAPRFDMVSSPSLPLHVRFSHLPHARLHPHAVQKDLFDRHYENPYSAPKNAVFVGVAFLDRAVIRAAAERLPDWNFHIIGPFRRLPEARNIFAYGEMAFQDTIPYIKHADIGLTTLTPIKGGEVFSDSLKVVQYTYCRLPIVAPEFLQRAGRNHVFHYDPAVPESVVEALLDAWAFDRSQISTEEIWDWSELAAALEGRGEGS